MKLQEALNGIVDFSNFHPMEFYDKMMAMGQGEVKELAKKLEMPYRNKRSFTKLLIEKIESNVKN